MFIPPKTNEVKTVGGFDLSIIESPDTRTVMVQPALIDKLAQLGAIYKDSMIITSGFRTPEHNASVGGKSDSQHLIGAAVDLVPHDGDLERLAHACNTVGFSFVLVESDHVHADVRGL